MNVQRFGVCALTAIALLASPVSAKKDKPPIADQFAGTLVSMTAPGAMGTRVTIWVDASWGFRNQGAANSLSRAHQAFAGQGYKVLSVEPYIENGDLQGFFVTYQKSDATQSERLQPRAVPAHLRRDGRG